MHFGSPHWFWLLLLLPALAVFFWSAWRTRQRIMTQFIRARLLPGLLADVSPRRRKIRRALFLLAVALIVTVLARPKWGFHLEEIKQRGRDIVVAIDTSRSMLAGDVAPNRLDRAKLEALALKQLCGTDRLGLVAFAGTAFLQCPLSFDDDAFRQSLEALDANIIPQGGTALAEAIRTALTAFKEETENHKVLVLLTDGEDHDGQAVAAAKEAAQDGMRIFTIGVGTPAGELISTTDPQGNRVFIKDENGNVVKSHLNEPLLTEIAQAGQGFYLPLTGARTMDALYERGLAPLPKSDSEVKTIRQYHERFQWFLGLALLVLLAEMFLADTKRGTTNRAPGPRRAVTVSAVAALLMALPASAASAAKAMRAYEKGQYGRAFREFEKLAQRTPKDARVFFNMGAAAYRDEEFETAREQFTASLTSQDVALQQRAYYNLGNTHFRLGEGESAMDQRMAEWQQAVSSYENALKLDSTDADARYNLELVRKKLEELKQQQQTNQDKQDDQDQQNQSDQNKDDQQDDQQREQQQNKSGEQQQQQQEQPQADQQKQEQQKSQQEQQQQQPQPAESQDGEERDSSQEPNEVGKMMQMTPQQARRLLDTLKAEEKPMIFVPQVKTNQINRPIKNW